jgi:hypothetical protein
MVRLVSHLPSVLSVLLRVLNGAPPFLYIVNSKDPGHTDTLRIGFFSCGDLLPGVERLIPGRSFLVNLRPVHSNQDSDGAFCQACHLRPAHPRIRRHSHCGEARGHFPI